MKWIFLTIVFSVFVLSCGGDEESESAKRETDLESQETETVQEDFVEEEFLEVDQQLDESSKSLVVRFKELTLFLDSLEVWDENNALAGMFDDTAELIVELGSEVEGRLLRIDPELDATLSVFQSYETSVSVTKEGPHCDLLDWEQLEEQEGYFQLVRYTPVDREKFVEVRMDEVETAVRNQCGDEWVADLDGVTSVNDYPVGVGISQIRLKVVVAPADGSQPIERFIIFKIPMGC